MFVFLSRARAPLIVSSVCGKKIYIYNPDIVLIDWSCLRKTDCKEELVCGDNSSTGRYPDYILFASIKSRHRTGIETKSMIGGNHSQYSWECITGDKAHIRPCKTIAAREHHRAFS